MLNYSKSMTFSGTSEIEENTLNQMSEKKVVAYLSASVGDDGKPTFNESIQDTALYLEYQTEVDSDIKSFKDVVWNCIKEV